MRKFKAQLICGGLLAAAIAWMAPSATAAAGSSVAGWVKNAVQVGTAPANQSVTIAIHLALANTAALQTLATAVSSPASPQYGRYLTPQEFGARFAPSSADVQAVTALLSHAGMADVTVGPHGVYVSAVATVAQLRTTFKVSQNLYTYQGKTLRANKEEPTLPAALAAKIVFVEGLDDTALLRTPAHQSATQGALVSPAAAGRASVPQTITDAASGTTTAVTPPPVSANNPSPYCNGYFGSGDIVVKLSAPADVYGAAIPWLNCGYTPQQIQAAYGVNKVKYDGKGVTVAITDAYASPTIFADANRYAVNHKLPPLVQGKNFSQIVPVGIYDVSPSEACDPYGWWLEQSLDFAAVHGMAPGATIVYVGARDCGTSLDIAFFNTVYNHIADVVTNSWSQNGEAVAPGFQAAYDQAATAGAAQGVTILFSSGDDGDLSQVNGVASGAFPSTSPWVTGVGGTSLLLESNGTVTQKAEYGWGTFRALLSDAKVQNAHYVTTSGLTQVTNADFGLTYDDFIFYAGSGGGISILENQPSYQAKVVPYALATTLNLASAYTEALPTPHRVSPDVALDADPYTGYVYGETFTIAGNQYADHGCTPISTTEEYCENTEGGTSLSSPLMAGIVAVMNEKRRASGEPVVGFANPWLYRLGSGGNGVNLMSSALNQIVAPAEPVSVLRGYAANLEEVRVVTINSVPLNIQPAPFELEICSLPICEGIDDVFNYTSLSSAAGTPAGYNDVTGLGVPYVPKLINEE